MNRRDSLKLIVGIVASPLTSAEVESDSAEGRGFQSDRDAILEELRKRREKFMEDWARGLEEKMWGQT